MKNRKRNITMIAVLLFVCAAVLLNWSYNNRWGEPDAEMVSAEDEALAQANALSASPFAKANAERKKPPALIISDCWKERQDDLCSSEM